LHNEAVYALPPVGGSGYATTLVSLRFTPTQTKVPALPFGNRLRKDALRESHNRQEQNEALTKAVLDFTEGIGIIKTYNLQLEKSLIPPMTWIQSVSFFASYYFHTLSPFTDTGFVCFHSQDGARHFYLP
jgi:hypothetical protein